MACNVRENNATPAGPRRLAALWVGLVALAGCRPPPRAQVAGAAAAGVHVTTCSVTTGSIVQRLEGIGHVEGWQTARVLPQVDGLLEAIHFREGEQVRRGQSLGELDRRAARAEEAQALARVGGAAAQVELSRLGLRRAEALRRDNLNAPQDLDQARATLLANQASRADAEAQVALARLKLAWARLPAPFDGVAGVRLVHPGNLLRAGDPNAAVVQLVQMDPCAVMVSLPEDVLPALRAAMARGDVEVQVRGTGGGPPEGLGTLWVIDNQIQPTSGTVRLKVRVDNPQRRLWPGQFVRARLAVGRRDGLLMVPAEAVAAGPGPVVWVVGDDGRAAQRRVETGAQDGGWAEITAGLTGGEQVVIAGGHLLRPGREVVAEAASAEVLPPPAGAL